MNPIVDPYAYGEFDAEGVPERASSCTGRSRCSDFSSPKYDRVCQTCGADIYQGVMCAACWSARAFPPKNPNDKDDRADAQGKSNEH